jgi:myosin heavy subunit
MTNKELINFIIEARKRGFSDLEIKNALIKNNWPEETIQKAFDEITKDNLKNQKIKNQVCIFLSDDILKVLEKRAKKNLMNLEEQIQDILRRSCVRKKATSQEEKIDDFLVSCFSRSSKGRSYNSKK